MTNEQRDDGRQNGPGEQIRPQEDRENRENRDLDNLRGGADPSGGTSADVPRDNSKAGPAVVTPSDSAQDEIPRTGTSGGHATGDDVAREEWQRSRCEDGHK
ncbi:hypothetical protein [Sphingopyxis terrae]|uniref:Uncharacterized protein n=1 Tax=Sphingopyxis terrae subsp. ummariensis TaxID=429001 RepID=A0A1Y6FN75_9SPHN|nr:hypothetical protein [Sphingopyxis terrae]PCF90967.1 hypothetical protein CPA46_10935 [Sphingopyxis terrae subsp. ummariensis]SMQ76418.1 hypothetical protein SAMN06295984_1857 [Sphingopyxis terrae subsp. ummariensis]